MRATRATDRGSPRGDRTSTPLPYWTCAVPAAILGRVTMDMCMVAVDDGRVAVGDVATVFGGMISLDEQAKAAGTISYELLTRLGGRVARCYGRLS